MNNEQRQELAKERAISSFLEYRSRYDDAFITECENEYIVGRHMQGDEFFFAVVFEKKSDDYGTALFQYGNCFENSAGEKKFMLRGRELDLVNQVKVPIELIDSKITDYESRTERLRVLRDKLVGRD